MLISRDGKDDKGGQAAKARAEQGEGGIDRMVFVVFVEFRVE